MSEKTEQLPSSLEQLKNDIEPSITGLYQTVDCQIEQSIANTNQLGVINKTYSNSLLQELHQKIRQLKFHCTESLASTFNDLLERQQEEGELLTSKSAGFINLDEINLDHLSLMDPEELELNILVSNCEKSLAEEYAGQLAVLGMRFEYVLQYDMDMSKLPLSPAVLASGLLQSLTCLEIELEEKHALLAALLVQLEAEYLQILDTANRSFAKNNVLAKLTEDEGRERQKKKQKKAEAKESRNKLLDDVNSDSDGSEQNLSPALSKLLQTTDVAEKLNEHIVHVADDAPILDQAELFEKIDLISSKLEQAGDENTYYQPYQESDSLVNQLESKAQQEAFGLTEKNSTSISMVSMLFEELLGNENIDGSIKSLLSQLQAPLLKAAIQTDDFFDDVDNPAQQLFDDLSEAGLSWTPEENPAHDNLYQKMSDVVAKVGDDHTAFGEAVEEFEGFTRKERRRSKIIDERLASKEKAKARAGIAKEVSGEHLESKFSEVNFPDEINDFINATWRHNLFFIHNDTETTLGNDWQRAEAIEDKMLSILGKAKEPEAKEIENLCSSITEQLQAAGIDQHEINSEVEKITPLLKYTKNLVNRPAEDAGKYAAQLADGIESDEDIETAKLLAADLDEMPSPEKLVKQRPAATKAEAAPITESERLPNKDNATDQFDNLANRLSVGTWLNMPEGESSSKVKVAAYIKHTDTYIIVDRKGQKVAEYITADLAQKFREGELVVIETTLMFDKALESVIHNMRV